MHFFLRFKPQRGKGIFNLSFLFELKLKTNEYSIYERFIFLVFFKEASYVFKFPKLINHVKCPPKNYIQVLQSYITSKIAAIIILNATQLFWWKDNIHYYALYYNLFSITFYSCLYLVSLKIISQNKQWNEEQIKLTTLNISYTYTKNTEIYPTFYKLGVNVN